MVLYLMQFNRSVKGNRRYLLMTVAIKLFIFQLRRLFHFKSYRFGTSISVVITVTNDLPILRKDKLSLCTSARMEIKMQKEYEYEGRRIRVFC